MLINSEMRRSFSDVDSAIWKAMLQAGSSITEMSVNDVASLAHVSPASVTRFCKKVGCSGFGEFRYRFRDSLEPGRADSVNGEVIVQDARALEHLATSMQAPEMLKAIDGAVDLLRFSDLIVCLGMGLSGQLACIAASLFGEAGYLSMVIDNPFCTMPSQLPEETTVVAISFSGETFATIDGVERLVASGCPVVGVTSAAQSSLARIATQPVIYEASAGEVVRRKHAGLLPVLFLLEQMSHRMGAGR